MSVTLTQPAEGLGAGESYSGPNEDWLVANGYAMRPKDNDGLHQTDVDKQHDPTMPANREAAGEEPPQPKTESRYVAGEAESYRAPDLKAAVDTTQPNQKAVDQMLKEVEEGKRDPNAPNVVLDELHARAVESRDYDGSPVTEIQKRTQAENAANLTNLAKQDEERRAEAVSAAKANREAQMSGTEQVAPAERVLFSEEDRPTGNATVESTEPEWALLPELGTNVDVGKQFAADVTDEEKVRADLKEPAKKAAPKKATVKD